MQNCLSGGGKITKSGTTSNFTGQCSEAMTRAENAPCLYSAIFWYNDCTPGDRAYMRSSTHTNH